MENKKIILVSVGILALGIGIYFSIKPFKKMIANYRGENTPNPIKSDSKPLNISQKEADNIVSKIKQVYKDANEKFGGLTSNSNEIKNQYVEELSKGGYKVDTSDGGSIDGMKAVLK